MEALKLQKICCTIALMKSYPIKLIKQIGHQSKRKSYFVFGIHRFLFQPHELIVMPDIGYSNHLKSVFKLCQSNVHSVINRCLSFAID